MEEVEMTRRWIRLGAVSGVVASLSYPALILVPLPLPAVAAIACLFGVSLSVAAVGGYHLIALNRKTVTLQIGAVANVVAGVLVTCMLLIQLGVNSTMETILADAQAGGTEETVRQIWSAVDHVQLGVDVAWDVYISIGTLLIAWNLRRHPRFGPFFGWPGVVISVLLLVLNMMTFPTPPAQAGLVDFGPLLGLWAFAMAIQVVRSLKWADQTLERQNA
jgi:hypothetical protein